MAETVKLTINGKPVEAEKGTLLIEAARQNGLPDQYIKALARHAAGQFNTNAGRGPP